MITGQEFKEPNGVYVITGEDKVTFPPFILARKRLAHGLSNLEETFTRKLIKRYLKAV